MNRIEPGLLAGTLSDAPHDPSHVEQSTIQLGQHNETDYSLFAPLHYEQNYAYPLLVWLHGPRDDQRQLNRVMPLISMRNYVGVAPRGTLALRDGRGYAWNDEADAIEQAEQRVLDCIRLANERFNIAPSRIFIGGFQCGGTMAFRLAMLHPEWFAGVLSVAGPFPTGMNPLGRVEQARGMPLFLAHGRDSVLYPVERTCDELRLFHAAGLSVSLRQYPCGDELDTQMLHDMNVWMMEQVTGVDMTNESSATRQPGENN